MAPPDVCRVGLLGLGTVGGAVARLLLERADELTRQAGVPIVLHRVAVAHPERPRAVTVPPGALVGDARAVVTDPAVDVVVEAMGGIEPARSYLLEALTRRKAVVTANKQLMSTRGDELRAAAEAAGVDLCFEASVAGGIPIIKTIREALAGNRIRRLLGIINGTTNFILTRMMRDGVSFGEALADAQQRGFAEADPTDDVDGHDAAAKLAILASVAFGCRLTSADVYREGIGEVTPRVIAYGRELGYVVKLLAIAGNEDGAVEARVHPALLPADHPLAGVGDEVNAVLIEADPVGRLMLEGRGAGGGPTASAVLGDVVDVARNLRAGAAGRLGGVPLRTLPVREIADAVLPYCVAMEVADRPGVFARVAAVFGDEQVSIASIVQKSRGPTAEVVLVTHEAPEAAMRRVMDRLRRLDVVRSVHAALRIAA